MLNNRFNQRLTNSNAPSNQAQPSHAIQPVPLSVFQLNAQMQAQFGSYQQPNFGMSVAAGGISCGNNIPIPQMYATQPQMPIRQISDPRRKLELEQQRQRLQQFSLSGSAKPSVISPDQMINSILGSTSNKQHSAAHIPLTSSSTRNATVGGNQAAVPSIPSAVSSSTNTWGSNKPSTFDGTFAHSNASTSTFIRPHQMSDISNAASSQCFYNQSSLPAFSNISINGVDNHISASSLSKVADSSSTSYFPEWTALDFNHPKIPDLYRHYYRQCINPDVDLHIPDTAKVYQLLLASGLGREMLGHVWSQANRFVPGRLSQQEFFVVLALVAIAQERKMYPTVEILRQLPQIPIPNFVENIPLASMPPQTASSAPFSISQSNDSLTTNENNTTNCKISKLNDKLNLAIGNRVSDDEFGEFTEFSKPKVTSVDIGIQKLGPEVDLMQQGDQYAALKELDVSSNVDTVHSNQEATSNQITSASVLHFDGSSNLFDISNLPTSTSFVWAAFSTAPKGTFSSYSSNKSTPDNISLSSFGIAGLNSTSSDPSLNIRKSSINEDAFYSTATSSNNTLSVGHHLFTSSKPESNEVNALPAPVQFQSSNFVDKYAAMKDETAVNYEAIDRHESVWMRCLSVCHEMLKQACHTLQQTSSSDVCRELLHSEKGANYYKGIGEIYRVACRIRVSLSDTSGLAFQTKPLISLLDEINNSWETMSAYILVENIFPPAAALDFSDCSLARQQLNDDVRRQLEEHACGVCLLDVECRRKQSCQVVWPSDSWQLQYASRRYHSQCANLWINFVDSLLPKLSIPLLL